jgi:hypothetical protein
MEFGFCETDTRPFVGHGPWWEGIILATDTPPDIDHPLEIKQPFPGLEELGQIHIPASDLVEPFDGMASFNSPEGDELAQFHGIVHAHHVLAFGNEFSLTIDLPARNPTVRPDLGHG